MRRSRRPASRPWRTSIIRSACPPIWLSWGSLRRMSRSEKWPADVWRPAEAIRDRQRSSQKRTWSISTRMPNKEGQTLKLFSIPDAGRFLDLVEQSHGGVTLHLPDGNQLDLKQSHTLYDGSQRKQFRKSRGFSREPAPRLWRGAGSPLLPLAAAGSRRSPQIS